MLKNITLSADEKLIIRARKKAKSENTTLNSRFRQWLENYTNFGENSNEYDNLMQHLIPEPTDFVCNGFKTALYLSLKPTG